MEELKNDKKNKKKQNINKKAFSDILDAEKNQSSNINKLEIKKGEKITKDNIFALLDAKSDKKNILVPRKIKRMLVKLNTKKHKKETNKNLKNDPDKVIEIKNVSKYYVSDNVVTRVLKNVTMDVKKGELILIFGISGGGKSTLLNLMSGLDRPTKGDVIVCNNSLAHLSNNKLTLFRRKHVSFIFQNYNLLENLSAYDNVETGRYLQLDPERKNDIYELFKKFGLEEEINKYPSQMSGGQQQRVSIMRALAKNSDIIFADEPTGALDEITTKIVLKFLYEVNKEKGTTVVMVSHNPIMAAMADRVVYVSNGIIEKIEVNKNPIHPDEIDLFKE
ncbi:ABC transporter ATP-binding protein [Mycoplasma tauri]|uniref:ABC transporter ATP-binding protein n=1 Tax=Mycoplasma tauri TaxID=547987 RepID=UPI001CC08DA8|nr:ABC transporter ATP-binding protein [Mycoplasma tauri]MBZ4204018.1 ABC transporter ATP-binding protein [Mycoplasma tauri]